MKNTCLIFVLAVIFGLLAALANGGDASVQQGEKLFSDPGLGGSKNPESCNTCHPGGKGLETSGVLPNLAETINYCIERPLRGNKIDAHSMEMQSLILYIKSLAG